MVLRVFIHSLLPEFDFCPPLCSTKLVKKGQMKAKSELEVSVSFHTGGTLSNSFWKDIKRWDDKTNVVGNRESLVRRHTLTSADTKLALRNCSINEFDMTNVLPVCPFPVDLTQSNSTIACDSRVPSMANVGPKTATGKVRTAENGPRLSISDDEGCIYDVASHEASLSPMQASFIVGSMPNIAEDNVVAFTRKHSVDSNLSSAGTPFLSAMSSRSRFTVAPVDEMYMSSLSAPPPYPEEKWTELIGEPPMSPLSTAPPNTPMPADGEPPKMIFPPRPAPPIAQKEHVIPSAPMENGMPPALPAYLHQIQPMMQQQPLNPLGFPGMPTSNMNQMGGLPYPQCFPMQPMMPYLHQPSAAANGGINVVVNSNANANSSAAGGIGKPGMKVGQICPYCRKGVISRIQDKQRKTVIIASSIVSVLCCLCCLPCCFLHCNYVDGCPVCKKNFGHRGTKGVKK